ncbi:MAG: ribonuclease P protein component [Firmicutes bacterium]|nr:ribonuclease P protein component [Bacillota bacterium]
MLKLDNRLKKRKSFNYIYRKGKHIGNEVLTLVFVPARVREVKIGFSVSKKVGNAVTRNKATRKMKSAARELVPLINPNHTLIFVAKEGIDKIHVNDIKMAMENVLTRAKVLR